MTPVLEALLRPHSVAFEFGLLTGRCEMAPSCADVLGIEAAMLSSKRTVIAIRHPDDRGQTAQVVSQALDRLGSFDYQSRVVRGDGHFRTVRTTGATELAPDGRPRAVVGSVTALSEWVMPTFEPPLKAGDSEGDLAVALVARLEEAHCYAFNRYAGAVGRAAATVVHNREQIEDIAQSVFESLWRNPARFDPNRGSLSLFLQMQARSRGLDLVRSESSQAVRERRYFREVDVVGGAGDEYSTAVSRLDIRRALDPLPATERAAIELAFFGHMSYREVALSLAVAEGTVKGRIRSGLSRLRWSP